jgi:hypothetical protein
MVEETYADKNFWPSPSSDRRYYRRWLEFSLILFRLKHYFYTYFCGISFLVKQRTHYENPSTSNELSQEVENISTEITLCMSSSTSL